MPVGKARKDPIRTATRTTGQLALVAALLVLGPKGLRAADDIRTLSLQHTHRDDSITVTFKRNGRYDEEGLKKLNYFLRDWRTDDVTTMDPQLYDAVWEVVHQFGSDKVVHIVSSYRSPKTNAMLVSRSSGVARHSLHMQGKAMDIFIPGVPLDKLREAGLRLQRGGVGFYPTSGSPFVHIDVGNVRMWPRMTREQLARVFPDGRTVHLPSDGHPLAGYALAQADLEKRKSSPSAFETARIAANDTRKPANPLARFFGFKPKVNDEEESETPAAAQVATAAPRGRDNIFAGLVPARPDTKAEAKPDPAPVAATPAKAVAAAAIPVPKARPSGANAQVAVAPAGGTYTLAGISQSDIFSARGYWSGLPDTQADHPANRQIASADATTGSIGPFAAPPGYGEGKPREATLAYATQADPEAQQRAKTGAAAMPRQAAVAANTTIASKARPNAPTEVQSAPALPQAREWQLSRMEGPWVRAIVMTPSVERFMNTTLYGVQDYRSLQPLLQTPTETVLMSFAADANPGLTHKRFEGRAIEFLATATFRWRNTVALR